MKLLMIIMSLAVLAGCATTVTREDGTQVPVQAYIAEKQHAAEEECYKSRSVSMPDSEDPVKILGFAVAMMALQNAEPCRGTNSNDVAIAKTKARWGFARSLARTAAGAYGVGELADFGKSLANAKGDTTTFNSEFGSVSQSASSSVSTSSGGGDLGSPNNAVNTDETGIRSNSIIIGGEGAVSGDRAATGRALVNGDSSVITSNTESDVKGSDTAETINKNDDQSVFNDDDGGNGVSVDF